MAEAETTLAEVLAEHTPETHYGDLESCRCGEWSARTPNGDYLDWEDFAAHLARVALDHLGGQEPHNRDLTASEVGSVHGDGSDDERAGE